MNTEVNQARLEWLHDQILKLAQNVDEMNDLLHRRVNNRKEELEALEKKVQTNKKTAETSVGIWGHVWAVVKYILAGLGGVLFWLLRDQLT